MYCIDTSALISAWKEQYPPDIFLSFWRNVEKLILQGTLISPDEVLRELEDGSDDLHSWAKKQADFFVPLDKNIQIAVSGILSHPEHRKLVNLKSQARYVQTLG